MAMYLNHLEREKIILNELLRAFFMSLARRPEFCCGMRVAARHATIPPFDCTCDERQCELVCVNSVAAQIA